MRYTRPIPQSNPPRPEPHSARLKRLSSETVLYPALPDGPPSTAEGLRVKRIQKVRTCSRV